MLKLEESYPKSYKDNLREFLSKSKFFKMHLEVDVSDNQGSKANVYDGYLAAYNGNIDPEISFRHCGATLASEGDFGISDYTFEAVSGENLKPEDRILIIMKEDRFLVSCSFMEEDCSIIGLAKVDFFQHVIHCELPSCVTNAWE